MKLKSHILAIGAMLVTAVAHAAPTLQIVDVDWRQDGHTIMAGSTMVMAPVENSTPLHFAAGTRVGYATCTASGASFTLQSNQKFVGRSLTVRPVTAQNGQVQFAIEASDTSLADIKLVDAGPCKSEVVETAGLQPVKLTATVAQGKTATVPFPDAHYELRLKLHADE
ncbi:hypothetical protein [Burkholderia vietnamiensis]|uniref:hypothetical protein n=1 Tax=Burkholderia vietnamiensis TaxID=60552 RepID=UPI001CF59AFB|nr:hypothetical protein [Burkholderia vietnamiensis]MCA8291350.1 hypothetical protein [Burkholderia vietnamiensis]